MNLVIAPSIFPVVSRLYSNHYIVGIKESWKQGSGWSAFNGKLTAYTFKDTLLDLKIKGNTVVQLIVENKKTGQRSYPDYKLYELNV